MSGFPLLRLPPIAGAVALLLGACNTTAPMAIDRPDPDAPEAVETPQLAEARVPDAMVGESRFKPIRFSHAISGLRHGTVVMHFPADRVDGLDGALCNYRHSGESTWEWRATDRLIGDWDGEVGKMVHGALAGHGFDMAGDPDALFEVEDALARAQYLLGARLERMVGNGCEEHHWWDGRPLGRYAAEVQIAVDWILYDPLRERQVAVFSTEGYGIQKKPKATGIADAFYDAWGAATDKLASEPGFMELLAKRAEGTFRAEPVADAPIAIEAIARRDLPIRDYLDHVLDATVSVRSGVGLGSGFLISRAGLILTNQHVTGDAETVTVVFRNGIEVAGTVLRRHARRDVALIQVPITGGNPFPVDFEPPAITEEVYAIGNPFDEDLRSTVTRGVVSALRREAETGLRLIQADVDIQSGNSGGPLVDGSGNVVGISVAGLGTGDGTSIGVNLFIPIESAFALLNLRIEGRTPPAT